MPPPDFSVPPPPLNLKVPPPGYVTNQKTKPKTKDSDKDTVLTLVTIRDSHILWVISRNPFWTEQEGNIKINNEKNEKTSVPASYRGAEQSHWQLYEQLVDMRVPAKWGSLGDIVCDTEAGRRFTGLVRSLYSNHDQSRVNKCRIWLIACWTGTTVAHNTL